MKICILSPNILPLVRGEKEGFGGAEIDLFTITKSLTSKGLEVTMVCIGNSNERFRQQGIDYEVIEKYSGPTGQGLYLRYLWRTCRTLYRVNSDIYLAKPAGLEAVIMFLVASLKRKPYYFRLSSDLETNAKDLEEKIFHRRWLKSIFLFFLRRAHGVISQSQKQQQNLKQNFIIDSQIIYPGRIVNPPSAVTEKSIILWAGRINPIKQPELFLKLAAAIPDQRFVMIGSRNLDFNQQFDQIRISAEKVRNLLFIPGLEPKEVSEYFVKAKVFVSTSVAEGFPQVFVEAFVNKTPVVSLMVDPDGFLQSQGAGVCAHGNWELFVQSIRKLAAEERLRNEFGANAYHLAVSKFDIGKISDEYLRLFSELPDV